MDTPRTIYLAGKIGPDDWRSSIADGIQNWQPRPIQSPPGQWPVLPKAIFGRFDYVGPFYSEPRHKTDWAPVGHGVQRSALCWKHSGDDDSSRNDIARACLEAINRADLFFLWLDSDDAHGSLVELGYALGLSSIRGLPEVIVATPEYEYDKPPASWFAIHAPSPFLRAHHFYAPTPRLALEHLLPAPPKSDSAFESPAEEAFFQGWQALHARLGTTPKPLQLQHGLMQGRYRVDFADLPSHTAIEIDGYAYHNDKERFEGDRKRDRALAAIGWETVRFAAKEVFSRPEECAREALAAIIRRATSQSE